MGFDKYAGGADVFGYSIENFILGGKNDGLGITLSGDSAAYSPSFMMEPLPKRLCIWPIVSSRTFSLSVVISHLMA